MRRGGQGAKRATSVIVLMALVVAVQLAAAASVDAAPTSAPTSASVVAPLAAPPATTTLFSEDFEAAPPGANLLLSDYHGAEASYTADSAWLSRLHCNGLVLDWHSVRSGEDCDGLGVGEPVFAGMQRLSYGLGVLGGSADPSENAALDSFTEGADPGANRVELETDQAFQVPVAGRFVTFGADAVATDCGAPGPRFRFSLRTAGGQEDPLTQAPTDPCTTGALLDVPDKGTRNTPVYGQHVSSDGSTLLPGGSFGLVMRNEEATGNGNDGAVDNLRVTDVTPQLGVSLAPAAVAPGSVATLTFTVTNTQELGDKDGWRFTDHLPSGLTLADSTVGGTCGVAGTAHPGGSTVDISEGRLLAGQSSCTVTVQVTSSSSQDYQICVPTSADVLGLKPQGCAPLSVGAAHVTAATSVTTTGTVVAGSILDYRIVITNTGTLATSVDYYDDLTHALDDAAVITEPTSGQLDVTRSGTMIRLRGPLGPGETVTVVYRLRVRPDAQRGDDAAATFLRPATGDGDPQPTPPEPICRAQTSSCTLTDIGRLQVSLRADSSEPSPGAGTVMTYTLTLADVGRGPVEVDEVDDVTGVLDDATLLQRPVVSAEAVRISTPGSGRWPITGVLRPGRTVTITYAVTVRPGSGQRDHLLKDVLAPKGVAHATCGPGNVSDSDPGGVHCAETPLPYLLASKTVIGSTGAPLTAGQRLTYALDFASVGRAPSRVDVVDDLVDLLDDAVIVSPPRTQHGLLEVTRDGSRLQITGRLRPGQRERIIYTVQVTAGSGGDGILTNYLRLRGASTDNGTVGILGPTGAPEAAGAGADGQGQVRATACRDAGSRCAASVVRTTWARPPGGDAGTANLPDTGAPRLLGWLGLAALALLTGGILLLRVRRP
jgi:uncharacterized repeat protein (TIGR01451 family)